MSIYEVINPSDAVTFTADDDAVAAVAVLVLGQGKYGCKKEDDTRVLPVLFLGGFNEWHAEFTKGQGCSLNAYINANRARIAEALEGTAVCAMEDRKALTAAVGNDPKAVERWNEARRTSLNDICARARELAASYRT